MVRKQPGDVFVANLTDNIRDWPQVTVKVSPQMKAHVIEALHEEGWTLSMSEYIRVVLAKHVAEVLHMTPVEVISSVPRRGSPPGVRYLRVK